ncbi:MAG: DNA methylase [Ruminococcaceae bacterium]|nr:DNA methylase [Oscillospiraceae bacterium]
MERKQYAAIDLKSFYASVECVDRGLDPLDALLVVADDKRTEKTICLAVSPALKAYGIPGRARLFEVLERVKAANAERRRKAPNGKLIGKSSSAAELKKNPSLAIDFIVAPPQMAHYMKISTRVYEVYLQFVAPEDMHVYSVDEVFLDLTPYLPVLHLSARELTMRMIREVLQKTGITATAGIGTNLYLAKIAMDIIAKRIPADKDGVRLAELDEDSYRAELWAHKPITDFWRIGPGHARRLAEIGLYTMGDVARCSVGSKNDFYNADRLFNLFGINAELLIDHAWGIEPCTIADIKSYRPENHSLSLGQVLSIPYSYEKGRLIVREMTDLLVLDLVEKGLDTDQMVLTVCYDVENLTDPARRKAYRGAVVADRYGRETPKESHGSINLPFRTSSTKIILEKVTELYEQIANPNLLVRRIYIVANHVLPEGSAPIAEPSAEQLDMFTDYGAEADAQKRQAEELEMEKNLQKTILEIHHRFGKNAILKGMNFEEGATTKERNRQIGGHKA